jgi:ABC-type lipoprotein export system ATPase subunit
VVVLLGPSGSGKTTLLRTLAGLEHLSAGTVRVFGTELSRLSRKALAEFRATNLGFLDQHYLRALSPDLSCRENVALQLSLLGSSREEARRVADRLLERVGLAERSRDRPDRLSGGEQQRVAVCAAIAHRPRLLLADEPAGELDLDSAATVYRLLGEIAREAAATVVVVSHDPAAASIADRLLHIRDGRLVEQTIPGQPPALVVSRGGWVRLPFSASRDDQKAQLAAVEKRSDGLLLRPLTARARSEANVARLDERAAKRAQPREGVVAELREVVKRYGTRVLFDGLTYAFGAGRVTAVLGRSGVGKTTLLHLLAGLERPTTGDVVVAGEQLASQDRARLAAIRRESIGLVTQEPGLVPYLSAFENVALGLQLREIAVTNASIRTALEDVGLDERAGQRVSSLSAGERQRVAIARALVADVRLLLVDEPTARLDEETGRGVVRLLGDAARNRGTAVVCATHDPALIELADELIQLEDARRYGRATA